MKIPARPARTVCMPGRPPPARDDPPDGSRYIRYDVLAARLFPAFIRIGNGARYVRELPHTGPRHPAWSAIAALTRSLRANFRTARTAVARDLKLILKARGEKNERGSSVPGPHAHTVDLSHVCRPCHIPGRRGRNSDAHLVTEGPPHLHARSHVPRTAPPN
jgi:hypothetical protein